MSVWIVAAFAAVMVAGCQPSASSAPSEIAGDNVYTICPFGGELPAKEITDRAVAILGLRLAALEVQTSSIGVGACIDVTATTASPAQDAAVRAAVLGTGFIALLSLPVAAVQATVVGSSPPDGAMPIVLGTDFSGADTGAATGAADPDGPQVLGVRLSEAGATTIASWSQQHRGELAALAVDGVVVALPMVDDAWTRGEVTLTMGEAPPVPLEAIAAMLSSGPLPPEWAQPERPQG